MQTKRHSLAEAVTNVVVGCGVNAVANAAIFPVLGFSLSQKQNLVLVLIYTGISLVRSYLLRRMFNLLDWVR